ncbi:MAG: class I SAM-dependent methyltransferase [Planctomycetota bacterium]|jgi:SAM-dependent methyltransferase
MGELPQAATVPGLHERLWPFLVDVIGASGGAEVLDIGAGQGALTMRLHEHGFAASACDLHPESFRFGPVECRRANAAEALPYGDGSFDAAVAVEVAEHLLDPGRFFAECARVLREGGVLVLTTPNILSLKSRLRFLASGFPCSFGPLDRGKAEGHEHAMPLGLQQYGHAAARRGLVLERVGADRYQRSSLCLLPFWLLASPLMWLFGPRLPGHNTPTLLLGRDLFLAFRKA